MNQHQEMFPLKSPSTSLTPTFLSVHPIMREKPLLVEKNTHVFLTDPCCSVTFYFFVKKNKKKEKSSHTKEMKKCTWHIKLSYGLTCAFLAIYQKTRRGATALQPTQQTRFLLPSHTLSCCNCCSSEQLMRLQQLGTPSESRAAGRCAPHSKRLQPPDRCLPLSPRPKPPPSSP